MRKLLIGQLREHSENKSSRRSKMRHHLSNSFDDFFYSLLRFLKQFISLNKCASHKTIKYYIDVVLFFFHSADKQLLPSHRRMNLVFQKFFSVLVRVKPKNRISHRMRTSRLSAFEQELNLCVYARKINCVRENFQTDFQCRTQEKGETQ